MRLAEYQAITPRPCCRCGSATRFWDAIAGSEYCVECLDLLAKGEADAVRVKLDKRRCLVCYHLGSVQYVTFPLNSARPVEIDLCAIHLRGLIGRCLGPHAFEQFRRNLAELGLDVSSIFFLHETFYDQHGRALQPALGD